jgi:hypothetical protein
VEDELSQILSLPTTREEYDLIPDFSDSGPVVGFLGGVYALVLAGMIVIPIIVYLAPLIPFVLLFGIGAMIDKGIARVRMSLRRRRHPIHPSSPSVSSRSDG